MDFSSSVATYWISGSELLIVISLSLDFLIYKM